MAVLKPMKLDQFTPVKVYYFLKKIYNMFWLPIRKVVL